MSMRFLFFPKDSTPFHEFLSGKKAFYNQSNYLEVTKKDFASSKLLPVSYTGNAEYTIIRIAKQILSILIFPIMLYKLLHSFVGKVVLLPASSPLVLRYKLGYKQTHAEDYRQTLPLQDGWKYKRITVKVDGYKIDVTIIGKASTLSNGRWVLASNGNDEFYERKLCHTDFKQILSKVNGNGIVFNYPGVGSSSGLPSRQGMAKAYRALLTFLEDKERGIGAKEIIGYGHSIGGGVQGDALKKHKLKKDVRYVFVKSRTFSDLSTAASMIAFRPLGFLVRILGWNMDSVASSKALQAPEIILQTAKINSFFSNHKELKDSSAIIFDGSIPKKAALSTVLLEDPLCPRKNKTFFGIRERHTKALTNPSFLAKKIIAYLKQKNT